MDIIHDMRSLWLLLNGGFTLLNAELNDAAYEVHLIRKASAS
jgi:hypothetical protein